MEVQILHYYLNLIKKFLILLIIFLTFFIFYSIYFLYFKKFNFENYILTIDKGENIRSLSNKFDLNFIINKKILFYFLKFNNVFIDNINYGEFQFQDKSSLYNVYKILSEPSNVFYELTIVDGWEKYQVKKMLLDKFNIEINLDYNEILADTYNYQSTDSIKKIIQLMKNNKSIFFNKNKNKAIFKKYKINEIMVIASLIEKEGIDDFDKKMISSVIFNRLNIGMKLQIDASTIFSITKGERKLENKLRIKDLKIQDKYNTYYIHGLPPNPICYVGRKTIEIVLENYKSDYLFYFYNNNLKKHIYSKTFDEHKKKLNNFRKNK